MAFALVDEVSIDSMRSAVHCRNDPPPGTSGTATVTPAGSCGGFLFRSPAVRSALAAAGVGAAPPVTYCKPGTFQSGTPNATSAVGYPRGGLDASGLIGGMGGGNQ